MTTGRGHLAGRLSAPRWLRGAREPAKGVTERELRTAYNVCAGAFFTTDILTDTINAGRENVRSGKHSPA
jgi:hypothetical protein